MSAVVGIVPAGGSGERLGADRPKAFVVCAGRPLHRVEPRGARRRSATGWWWRRRRATTTAPDRVRGGESRSASVRNALAAAPEATVAVVHDAARPLVTRDLVERCIAALEPGIDGAIAAVPMTDTVKEAAPDGRVVRTLDRSRAVGDPDAAGVPGRCPAACARARRRGARRGHRRCRAGRRRRGRDHGWWRRSPENIKVTRASDLRIAEALLAD